MENERKPVSKGRILFGVCLLSLSLGFFAFMHFFYTPPEDTRGELPRLKLDGKRTEADPYLIKTAEELENFAQSVNGGNDFKGKYILLENDIDLSVLPDMREGGAGWRPIGNYLSEFRGEFDGGGYTVSGFWIDTNGPANVGFFGCIEDAVIRNLNVSGKVKSKLYVGLLVGYMTGTESRVVNCTAAGEAEVTQLPRSDDARPRVGGLIGAASYGKIENCSASVTVSVWGEGNISAGGLAGHSDINITNCRAYGDVAIYNIGGSVEEFKTVTAGGLVGTSSGNLENCHAFGSVTVWAACFIIDAGGLAGRTGYDIAIPVLFGRRKCFRIRARRDFRQIR